MGSKIATAQSHKEETSTYLQQYKMRAFTKTAEIESIFDYLPMLLENLRVLRLKRNSHKNISPNYISWRDLEIHLVRVKLDD